MESGGSHWRLFLTLLRPHRRLIVVYGAAVSVATGIPLVLAVLLGRFVDLAKAQAATSQLVTLAAIYVGIGLAGSLIKVTVIWRANVLAWAVTDDLRHDLADYVLSADLDVHRDYTRGELVSRADDDVTAMANFLSQFVASGISILAIASAATVTLTILRPPLGPVLGVCLTVAIFSVWLRRDHALGEAVADRDARGRAMGTLEERLHGADDIATLGAGLHSVARFAELSQAVVLTKKAVTRKQMSINGLTRVCLVGTEVAMLLAGAFFFSRDRISLGSVILGVRFASAARSPIESVTWRLMEFQGATGSAQRMLAMLANRRRYPRRTVNLSAGPLDVRVENVTMVYDHDEGAVLHDVSLVVPAGRVLGLVGRSGSGKTTLGRLILRLLESTSGAVLIGGANVLDITEPDFRSRVTGVPQEVQLFPGTVRNNVAMFDSTRTDASIESALRTVGLGQWFDGLTDGLDTTLLDRMDSSTGMSAGEAQLLALSRALVRNPSVVILDEATSRIDPTTQRLVIQAISSLLASRTGVVIAHRLDTLAMCDDIAVVERGRIVEFGPRVTLAADEHSRFGRLLRAGHGNAEASVDDVMDEVVL